MESMAVSIGVSVPVLRFLLCFAATIPISFLWRFVPGRPTKHLYSAVSGALLSYLSFGFSSNLHFLVPMLLGYASMVLFRRRCGIITFFSGFGYLIGWYFHIFYAFGLNLINFSFLICKCVEIDLFGYVSANVLVMSLYKLFFSPLGSCDFFSRWD